MGATGYLYTEIHSLFAGNPDGAFWSGHTALAPGPALAVAVGIWLWLGCTAAGAWGTLGAADAVGRTAVFRGRGRGGDLLPSCGLPCS